MRRIVKFPLFAFGSFMAILVVIVGVMFLMRPYWDLRGNFTPTFDFESPERHYDRLEASREAQKQAAGDEEEVQTVSLASSGASWSNYRGPNRDGISLETGLLQEWPEEGPPELYRQPVGGGYAGIVVGGGRVYTIEQRRDSEVIPAYDLETGRELWTYAYPAFFQEQMGGDGPRATPTLDGDRLYALGASGQLNCLDANTGEQLWGTNILEDAGTENLEWGMSGSPLIVDDRVMVTAAGLSGSALLAYDKASGELLWKALPGKQAYTSLMEVTLAGRRQLLNLASASLNGLDPETGELLWSFPWSTTNGINCSQPVVAGEDRIILSSGYGQGSVLIQLDPNGGELQPRQIWANTRMKNKFNSSIIHEGYIYGLDEGILVCLEVETGKRQWKSGRYGHGQMLYAEGNLIVLGESGVLALVRATPEGFQEMGRVKALRGKTWNTPALAGGRLLVRNTKELVCYDLRAKASL